MYGCGGGTAAAAAAATAAAGAAAAERRSSLPIPTVSEKAMIGLCLSLASCEREQELLVAKLYCWREAGGRAEKSGRNDGPCNNESKWKRILSHYTRHKFFGLVSKKEH